MGKNKKHLHCGVHLKEYKFVGNMFIQLIIRIQMEIRLQCYYHFIK